MTQDDTATPPVVPATPVAGRVPKSVRRAAAPPRACWSPTRRPPCSWHRRLADRRQPGRSRAVRTVRAPAEVPGRPARRPRPGAAAAAGSIRKAVCGAARSTSPDPANRHASRPARCWCATTLHLPPAGTSPCCAATSPTSARKPTELLHLLEHDPTTGLFNRSAALDRTASAVRHANRTGTELAVLMIDVDRLRDVNDALGHEIGDRLARLDRQAAADRRAARRHRRPRRR